MLLKRGSANEAVLEASKALVSLGYLAQPTEVFSRFMEEAVCAFQAQHVDPRGEPLVVDGEIGPLTLWALRTATGQEKFVVPEGRPKLLESEATGLAGAALAVAQAEYARGAGEKGGDNRGQDVKTYLNGKAAEGSDWCAGFVSHCYSEGAQKLGVAMPYSYTVGAQDTLRQWEKKGWGYKASVDNPPKAGDIIVWWRNSPKDWRGHIGIVHSYKNGIVRTIEGNKGPFPSKVNSFEYVLGRIERLLGFARIS